MCTARNIFVLIKNFFESYEEIYFVPIFDPILASNIQEGPPHEGVGFPVFLVGVHQHDAPHMAVNLAD